MRTSHAALFLSAALWAAGSSAAIDKIAKPAAAPAAAPSSKPCSSVTADPPTTVVLGKSTVIKLGTPVVRMVVGNNAGAVTRAGKPAENADKNANPPMAPGAADSVADLDIVLLSPTELFFIGKKAGSSDVVLQGADGRCIVKSLVVTVDPAPLQAQLAELLPQESGIRVRAVENALVLTGQVSSAAKMEHALALAGSFGDGKRVVNLMRVTTPQQVMLEVKIAEVSKTLLDKLGARVSATRSSGGGGEQYSLISNFLSNGGGLLSALKIGSSAIGIDGQKEDGLVRVLAEPNIMAISGQQASFLSGGKIFIPVAQNNIGTGTVITLEEKEFGIGVRFTPTVLDGSRINLKLVSEASDLSQTGSPFTTINGVVSIIPSFSVRKADTTVQLNDGQSFVIAGLIKNNGIEAIKRFPGLGEVPVLGALFRSTEFQKDQTELMFVVTPRLVKPLPEVPALPTANHSEPSRSDVHFGGMAEHSAAPAGK